jgi:nucleotide-binding universal stress UspA family protein
MLKPLSTILFATNLKENCLEAFNFTAALAVRFQAKIVLLHVLGEIPDYVEGRLQGLLGKEKWEGFANAQENKARQQLIGKKSTNSMIQKALNEFCSDAGINDESCGYQSREIVVSEGDLVTTIIETSQNYDCDLIVMGAREGIIAKTSLGPTIKAVLRQSEIPVTIVPSLREG